MRGGLAIWRVCRTFYKILFMVVDVKKFCQSVSVSLCVSCQVFNESLSCGLAKDTFSGDASFEHGKNLWVLSQREGVRVLNPELTGDLIIRQSDFRPMCWHYSTYRFHNGTSTMHKRSLHNKSKDIVKAMKKYYAVWREVMPGPMESGKTPSDYLELGRCEIFKNLMASKSGSTFDEEEDEIVGDMEDDQDDSDGESFMANENPGDVVPRDWIPPCWFAFVL